MMKEQSRQEMTSLYAVQPDSQFRFVELVLMGMFVYVAG